MGSKNAYIVVTSFIFVILIWAILAVLTIDPNVLVPSSEIITVLDWSLLLKVIIPVAIVALLASRYRRRLN